MPSGFSIAARSAGFNAISERRRRVAILFIAVILAKPFSNLFLTWGVRNVPETLSSHPEVVLHAFLEPLLIVGVGMQIFWLLARMALLGVADLSFVLPVTASGYVISALLGRVFLHEHVSAAQWAGTLLIFAGAVLAGSTQHNTTSPGNGSEYTEEGLEEEAGDLLALSK